MGLEDFERNEDFRRVSLGDFFEAEPTCSPPVVPDLGRERVSISFWKRFGLAEFSLMNGIAIYFSTFPFGFRKLAFEFG